jgi:hypothetical protein
MIVAWFAWTVPFAGALLATLLVVGHGSFAISNWSAACTGCIVLLLVEICSLAFCAWKSAFWRGDRTPSRRQVCILLSGVLGLVLGLLLLPTILYPDCPKTLRDASAPSADTRSNSIIIFVDPKCHFCAELNEHVLPAFRSDLEWFEVSRCNSQGLALMQEYDVTSFPTLLLLQNNQVIKRAGGIDDIRSTLKDLRSKRERGSQ